MKLKQILYEFSISSLKNEVDQFIKNLENNKSELLNFYVEFIKNEFKRPESIGKLVEYLNGISKKFKITFVQGTTQSKISDEYSKFGLVGGRQWIRDQSIDIVYNDFLIDQFKDDNTMSKFLKKLKGILIHEITHRYQFSSMNPDYKDSIQMKPYKNRNDYLADRTEIAAHAHGAIEEFKEYGYNDLEIKQLLKTPNMDDPKDKSKLMAKVSYSFWSYYKVFYMDDENRVWEIFLKYCYKYLKNET